MKLIKWLQEDEGATSYATMQIVSAKFLYLAYRILLRIKIGKQKRDVLMHNRKITWISFLLSDVIMIINGLKVVVRRSEEDSALMSDAHERKIVELLRKEINENDVFVDVGSHIGKYVMLAKQKIKTWPDGNGKVIAIEADPRNYSTLRKNCILNGFDDVICENLAISDQVGQIELYLSTDNLHSHSSLVKSSRLYQQYSTPVTVNTNTLDLLFMKKYKQVDEITWLIMDIEGAEVLALKGAEETLDRTKNMIIECHSEENFDDVKEILSPHFIITVLDENPLVKYIWARKKPLLS